MFKNKWSVWIISLFFFALCFISVGFANEVELNGFLIYQYRDAVKNALGKPFQTGETKNSDYEAYVIGDDAHMVFEFLKDDKDRVYSIQLSGTKAKMDPFKGLVLGDSRKKVIGAFGKPDSIEKVNDGKKDLLIYDSKNYSVELDGKGALVSIRIYGYEALFKAPEADNTKNWEGFSRAVLKKDFNKISAYFRPDAEIYMNGKVLSIDKSFKAFFNDHKNKFLDAIFSDSNSIYSEIKKSTPEREYRLQVDQVDAVETQEKMGYGYVHKFYKSKVVKEIYFLPYAGAWRIYEVKFRDKEEL